jgi:outer membrane protein OmpA-like peptidoglycan-associated protein
VSPAGGRPGALISLTGNFGARPQRVLVRGVSAAIVSASSSRVTIVLPNLTPGPADVALIVGGRRLTARGAPLEVGRPPNQPPVANMLPLPTSATGFVFDATLSVDPEGLGGAATGKVEQGLAAGIHSLLWNFGDGTTSTKPVVRKTYREPGEYRVTLRVTDASGLSSTTSQTVQTLAPPASQTVQTLAPPAGSRGVRRRPINIRIPSQIVFDFGSHRLRRESRTYLARVSKVVRRATSRTRVAGYTDSLGPATFNQRLSVARARTVKGFLSHRGRIRAGQLFAIGFGERRPLASNATELGRQKNRRVVLTFRLPNRSFARA